MKNKTLLIVLYGILFLTFHDFSVVYSQSNSLGVSIPSPNATSLGVFGEMPVSYFTGVPEISFPLYTVKGNKISLPVSLSYHAGGLRPEVHPGWVGNGWNLSAGGAITRKVNGQSDERQRLGQGQGKSGYYYNYSNLNSSDWNSLTRMQSGVYQNVTPSATSNLYDCDTEPDEFSFSFLGYSGRFFLDQTGNWQVQCDKSLKVIFNPNDLKYPFTTTISGPYDPNNISPTFGKFTIIDEFGNQYVFGSMDNNNTAIEFSDVMMVSAADGFGNTIDATSWYLTQIISADGSEVINLNYERGPLTSQLSYTSAYGGFQAPGVNTGFNWGIPNNYSSGCTRNINNSGISGNIIFPVYLVSVSMPSRNIFIDFSNKSKSNELKYVDDYSSNDDYVKILYQSSTGTFQTMPTDFPSPYMQNVVTMATSGIIPYYNAHFTEISNMTNYCQRFIWLKLDGITVKNSANNSIIQTVSFNYNNSSQQRLQLLSLTINDNSGQPVQKYSFDYNNATPLPKYLSTFTDHWGFNNNHLLANPFYTTPITGVYQNREPDVTGVQTQAEILTSITYPTGGKTKFIYEPNRYSQVVYRNPANTIQYGLIPRQETGIGGGLRIKQIISMDGLGKSMIKSYYYVNGFTVTVPDPSVLPSSGVLDSKPMYEFNNAFTLSNGQPIVYKLESSNSVIPATSNSAGSLIGYSEVVEQRSDGSYTQYKYTNHDNGYSDEMPFRSAYCLGMTYYPPTSLAFERGKLKYKAEFAVPAPGQERLVTENFATYSAIMPGTGGPLVTANALYDQGTNLCGSAIEWRRSAYSMYSFPFLPTSKTTRFYSGDGSGNVITKTTNLSYDMDRNIISKQSYNSKGQEELVNLLYPATFATSDPANPYNMMLNQHNVSTPVEKRVSVGGNLIGAEIYSYKIVGTNKVYNDAFYKFETTDPVVASSVTYPYYVTGGQLSYDSRYKKVADVNYDNAGNMSSVNKSGNEVSSYIWDYNQQLPTAKVINAANIYTNANASNPVAQTNNMVYISGTPYITQTTAINVAATGNNGTLNFSFAYNNPYISGNNSSIVAWRVEGVTNPAYLQTGSMCAATISATCNGVSTFTVSNLAAGTYNVKTTIVSVTGFSNYYGYKFNMTYPSYQYAIIAAKNDIGYTSFEYQNSNELNYGTGNFTGITLGNIQAGSAVTGDRYYSLTGASITKGGLDPSKTYTVSYWSNGSSYSVLGSQSVTQGYSLNFGNWKYFEHTVTNVSSVTISGAGAIDELRIYPRDAQMSTYTYSSEIGITSECDLNNNILYYEYDSFGRLKTTRDKDKNIIRQFEYKY